MSVPSKTKPLSQKLIGEAIHLGRIWAWIRFILVVLLGVLMLSLGIVILRSAKDFKYTQVTTADILSAHCVSTKDKANETYYDCSLKLSYTIEGVKYETLYSVDHSTTEYAVGDKIKIKYNPDDPSDVSLSYSPKTVGRILVSVGALLLVLAPVYLWFVLTFKLASAASGASLVYDLVSF